MYPENFTLGQKQQVGHQLSGPIHTDKTTQTNTTDTIDTGGVTSQTFHPHVWCLCNVFTLVSFRKDMTMTNDHLFVYYQVIK